MKLRTATALRFAARTVSLAVFSLLLAFTLARGESSKADFASPRFSIIVPGLEYAHVSDPARPLSIHIARLDRARREFDVITTLGREKIQGLRTLSEQAASVSPAIGQPLAAVNGSFFVLDPGPYQGVPGGLQILNGGLVTAPDGHSFWTEPDGQLRIDTVYTEFEVIWPGGEKTPMGLNQPPKPDGVTLFTPIFGDSTQASNSIELVLEKVEGHTWLPLRPNQTYPARVREIRPLGNTPLAPDIAILSGNGKVTNLFAVIKPGAILQLSTGMSKDLDSAHSAIGGSAQLLHNGTQPALPPERGLNGLLFPRNPRTALGFNSRYFYVVVVDGRQKELSAGMSLEELVAFMKRLGCTDALNLDGGGSTTFWLNGKVVNSPSEQHERPIANAIVIVRKPE